MNKTDKSSSNVLTGIYSIVKNSGLLESSFCKLVFQELYFRYKAWIEDPFEHLTQKQSQLFQGGHIIDVGANIGYTVLVFSRLAKKDFKVFAFEPEEQNFLLLQEALCRYKCQANVVAHRVAVGASSGVVSLWFNKSHHADHRILTPEFEKAVEAQAKKYEVPLITIDEFMKGIDGPVSFVKIDVQGYELPVCQGMEKTIDNNPEITVAFEYAPGQMQDLGFSGEDLLVFFRTRGFDLYVLDRKGTLEPLDGNNMAAYLARTQYFDVLATRRKIN